MEEIRRKRKRRLWEREQWWLDVEESIKRERGRVLGL